MGLDFISSWLGFVASPELFCKYNVPEYQPVFRGLIKHSPAVGIVDVCKNLLQHIFICAIQG